MICVYPVDDIGKTISRAELAMSPSHQPVQPALKSPVTIQQRGNLLIIWLEEYQNFCCYDHSANASEAVQKIAADQKEYHKFFTCVIIC